MDTDALLTKLELGQIDMDLSELFPKMDFHMETCLEQLLSGDLLGCLGTLFRGSLELLAGEIGTYREIFVMLVILGVISGVLSLFTDLFQRIRNTRYCFYFVFLSTLAITLKCYLEMLKIADRTLSDILTFMDLMIPTYFISVGASLGLGASGMLRQGILLLIEFVQRGMGAVVMPGVTAYILLVTLNGVWTEEKCGYLIRFLDSALNFFTRAALVLVSGMGFLHTIIAPMTDKAGRLLIKKPLEMMPWLGNAAEGVSDLLVGSASVIKNGVGVFLFLALCAICLTPVVKLFLTGFFLKAAASFVGLISEGKLASMINGYADGIFHLLKILITVLALFLIALGFITAMATG